MIKTLSFPPDVHFLCFFSFCLHLSQFDCQQMAVALTANTPCIGCLLGVEIHGMRLGCKTLVLLVFSLPEPRIAIIGILTAGEMCGSEPKRWRYCIVMRRVRRDPACRSPSVSVCITRLYPCSNGCGDPNK